MKIIYDDDGEAVEIIFNYIERSRRRFRLSRTRLRRLLWVQKIRRIIVDADK